MLELEECKTINLLIICNVKLVYKLKLQIMKKTISSVKYLLILKSTHAKNKLVKRYTT